MSSFMKALLVIVTALVGAVIVVFLSTSVFALTGSVVARWGTHLLLMIPFLYYMAKLGSYLGKLE